MALDFSEFPSPFRFGENLAQPPYSVTPVTNTGGYVYAATTTGDSGWVRRQETTGDGNRNRFAPTPADGDDMTWREGYDNAPLTYAALVATVYRLQNEMYALSAQVVELKTANTDLQTVIRKMVDNITMNTTNCATTALVTSRLLAQVVELREKVQAWEGDS